VSLLVSILVRFPQIGTVKIDSKKQVLWLNFMLSQSVEPGEIEKFQKQTMDILQAYHHITGLDPKFLRIDTQQPYERFCLLSIGRDIGSLTRGELSLIITSLTDSFTNKLIMDEPGFEPELFEDFGFPDDLIDSMLENMKFQRTSKSLTALRENGRVLVFSK
jgi:hypothetical protein